MRRSDLTLALDEVDTQTLIERLTYLKNNYDTIITEAQRFIYGLLALTFITLLILIIVLVHVFALEVFLALIIIEFLVLVELTKPPFLNHGRRKNITIFVIICMAVFSILIYQRAATPLVIM